jgi:hypothetical protein
MHMDGIELIQLKAFLLALVQLDVGLSSDLHQSIRVIGASLASPANSPATSQAISPVASSAASAVPNPATSSQNSPTASSIINIQPQIQAVLAQHYRLDELYQESYDSLLLYYQLQQNRPLSQIDWTLTTDPASQAFLVNELAVPILQAKDFTAAAREVLKRVRPLPPVGRVFVLFLEKAIASNTAKTIAVLEALEKRPLTVTGLVYIVGLTLDQAWTIVQELWRQGYIERATSSIVSKVFPRLKDRQHSGQTLDAETYLTLTARGHFHLHPVVSLGAHRQRL